MGGFAITIANRGGATYEVGGRRTLLAALEAKGLSLPYGCRYGGCISCAAKLLSGAVDQRRARALNRRQLRDGYILLCVARPRRDCVLDVGVESHDRLYRNPFKDPLKANELKPGLITPPDAPKNTPKGAPGNVRARATPGGRGRGSA